MACRLIILVLITLLIVSVVREHVGLLGAIPRTRRIRGARNSGGIKRESSGPH
ncbi:hypothetical protein PUN28_012020 [Cardiocondyla obscurior]|uniref:Uncharacterized protein n=1 Tax=Cardiocondyla obscurior TaxID=286306 RepID=A0AAW2F8T0_9HYME